MRPSYLLVNGERAPLALLTVFARIAVPAHTSGYIRTMTLRTSRSQRTEAEVDVRLPRMFDLVIEDRI
jgi:hypothetical protein